ncbi:MAG: pantetheine-phosphate adenylyltransferase [Bacillota bacterium]|nr:pantetheine-phosphate adenylyltransferase [Bacillota bacterium]
MIYPGTFDPLTNGHVDIARRAARLCDHLVVAVLNNSSKKTVFSVSERVAMARLALKDLDNLSVVHYDGLLVNLYHQKQACAVVRGLRSESDFRFEAEMAAANKLLLPAYETCLLPCRIDLAFTSSSIVREVALYDGDISGMVPGAIVDRIKERFASQAQFKRQDKNKKQDNNPTETGG